MKDEEERSPGWVLYTLIGSSGVHLHRSSHLSRQSIVVRTAEAKRRCGLVGLGFVTFHSSGYQKLRV